MSDMQQFIDFLTEADDLVALVMLDGNIHGRSTGRTAIGFYRDRERFLADAERLSGGGNTYVNLNQLHPDVYGRAADRLRSFSPTRFSDAEILRRRAILIDCDPVRIPGINSTDEELAAALEMAELVASYLAEQWGVEPLRIMSGNGAQLLYPVDEPADTPLVKQLLENLDQTFSTETVKVDTSVSDAARITRLPGTLNVKGDDVPDRPQRLARVLSVPGERRIVTTEQLAMLAPEAKGAETSGPKVSQGSGFRPAASKGHWSHELLREVLDNTYEGQYRVVTDTRKNYDEDTAYDLEKCPFIDHGDEKWKTRITLINGRAGFKCFHNSCSNPKKTFRDFLRLVAPDMLPEPGVMINHELHRAVAEAIDALGGAENTYQYGGALVSVVYDAEKPKLCLHDNGSPQLVPLPKPMLAARLSECAAWLKWDGRAHDYKRVIPPDNVVAAVHVAQDWPSVPVITGIVSCPVLRKDGSILTAPGYDELTGLYLDTDGVYPPLMPPAEAIELLDDVLFDFPFQSDAHRSGWIAALITLLARPAFAGSTPFFLIDANASRIGKGLLTDVLTMIVEGREACRYSWPGDNDEVRKLITTVGMSGAPYLLFDNVKTILGGAALENAMTTAIWADRLLSLNRQVQFPVTFAWIGTANNCRLTNDMLGRTQHIRMATDLENPAERSGFRYPDLLGHMKANRRQLAMAALSIPAGYVRAGRPDQHLPAWGGFQEWSDLVRNSIVWAGLPDPGDARSELAEQADDETGLLRALLRVWPNYPVTIAKVIELSEKQPELQEVLAELPGRDASSTLGYLLRDARGRNIGGKRIERVEDTRPTKWQVLDA